MNGNTLIRRFHGGGKGEQLEAIPFITPVHRDAFNPDDYASYGINVISEFNRSTLSGKSFIFSLLNTATECRMPYLNAKFFICETVGGVRNTYHINSAGLIENIVGGQSYSQLNVDSTAGFPESGRVQLYTTNWNGFFEYTSKTNTAFIGSPQVIYTGTAAIVRYVNPVIPFTVGSTNRYVIVRNTSTFRLLNSIGVLWAFSGFCTNMADMIACKTIHTAKYLTQINSRAIYWKGFVGFLNIGNYITNIANDSLRGNSGLISNIIIPANVKYIGDSALIQNGGFSGTLEIHSIPDFLGTNAFAFGASNLFHTLIASGGCFFVDDDVMYFRKDSDFRLIKAANTIEDNSDLTIKEGVRAIEMYGCSAMKRSGSLILPSTILTIEQYAFVNSKFTGTLILPEGLQRIGQYAFQNNLFTGDLTIPLSCSTIGAHAFYNSGFTGALTILNPAITLTNLTDASNVNVYAPFRDCAFTALHLPVGYRGASLQFNFSNYFSAASLNQSIINIESGMPTNQKILRIGTTNKARLLAAYPQAEINANARYILIE